MDPNPTPDQTTPQEPSTLRSIITSSNSLDRASRELSASLKDISEPNQTDINNTRQQLQTLRADLEAIRLKVGEYKTPNEQIAEAIAEAEVAKDKFITYLKDQGLSDEDIEKRLNPDHLKVRYNNDTKQAEIYRDDILDEDGNPAPFDLDLWNLDLDGELPLPKQMLISTLDCSNTNITSLPELPGSLTVLGCSHTKIQSLPKLPDSLTWLSCYRTNIKSLPELPSSLTELNCSNTNIKSLPELPSSLEWLDCSGCPLTDDAIAKIKEQQAKIGFTLRI